MPENSASPAIVIFENAAISNGDLPVIENFTFRLHEGEWVYLTGKVGSGKTSIIRSIIGENPVVSGIARVGGFDLCNLKKRQIPILRRGMGIIFQDFQLLTDRSVEENLRFALKATDWKDKAEIAARIEEVLQAVGMETKAHKMPYQLSGGEQQRIAIARALLNRPALILADEPTGNLDSETAAGIMDLIRSINANQKTAVMMVTHNQSIVREYPGRVLVCEDGRCTETPAEGAETASHTHDSSRERANELATEMPAE